jgi:hypothetical protein
LVAGGGGEFEVEEGEVVDGVLERPAWEGQYLKSGEGGP